MTAWRFGNIVGDERTSGILDAKGAILLGEVVTLAVIPRTMDADGVSTQPASVALQLSGRVTRTTDTVTAVWLFPASDAWVLVGEVLDAVARAGGEQVFSAVLDKVVERIKR